MRAGYRGAIALAAGLLASAFEPAWAHATPKAERVDHVAEDTTPIGRVTGFEIAATESGAAVAWREPTPLIRKKPEPLSLEPVAAPSPTPPPPTSVWKSGLLRADRLQHTSFALASGFGVGLLSREPAAGFGGALVLGLFKETLDAAGPSGFDPVDLAADTIGAAVAALLTIGLLR